MMDPNKDKDREEMARTHNPPPEVPRDRMWARIDTARSDRRGVLQPDFTPRHGPAFRIMRLAAGIAAVLVVGIFIGRTTQEAEIIPSIEPAPVAIHQDQAIDPKIRRDVYALAARDLFGRADYLLTDFKVRSCGKGDLSEVPNWAGGMLVQTRLLMGTSVAEDIDVRIAVRTSCSI